MAKPGVSPLTAYLFVAPCALVFAVFTVWPMLFNGWLAFQDYFIASRNTAWNDFANFLVLADSQSFHIALRNALLLLLTVPLIQAGALGLALLVHRPLPGITFFRATYYLPVVITVSIAGVVWQYVFHHEGILNWLLGVVGVLAPGDGVPWLESSGWSLVAVMAFCFWKYVGYYMVLYLVGLAAVPRELQEAAMLDGAGTWARFRHVVWPLLAPVAVLCSLLSTIGALKTFQEVLVLTRGEGDTMTPLLFVYRAAFSGFNFGVAGAASLLFTLVCLIVAALQLRLMGRHNPFKRDE
ncbi:carbohydrate ABC transporter permease [Chitiniphilus eburneus]|uniref:Sugar ABC transporter permease n=1 Tax=Chitiniphilus eburneus TaxID=2571148 RepID=A0A4U0PBF7_9NEIS|nr:sugar ABC transporter permease [Chitiniphilus eburneus]TJZ65016.1 sugar ABC transporter permease [Chitiniphilus eburneus]